MQTQYLVCVTLPTTTQAVPYKQPLLNTTPQNKSYYQTNNFAQIAQLEQKANSDITPIYGNITAQGQAAWTLVEDPKSGQQYYMSWSQYGSVWTYTQSITPSTEAQLAAEPTTTYQAVVQFGTYSQTSSVAGIHSYNLGLTTMVVESVVALILAKCMSSFIADGLGFLVSQFAIRLTQAAVELGFESFSFAVPEFLIGAVAGCLCFAIIFIGIAYLWNWLNRLYTLRVQVFNWDTNYNWQLTSQGFSNAVNPGQDSNQTQLGITLDKMVSAGGVVYPPGFNPVTPLDSVCYYAVIVYENDQTFAEGASFAIQSIRNNDTTQGFTYAFNCPRFADNGQYVVNSVVDPTTFLTTAESKWVSTPQTQTIQVTPDNTPVTVSFDYLEGASNDTYNINININQS
ncbi:hypothetical protein CYY_003898 [Polysphondylium violaceum]|uniref:Uncharacterized protein n=1 Tax=Polysphondylium violaceum TaxID=133409 RepID=A0A8J4PX10_9MYCE|nr:hypothetical protein CYY_003898 [Polysphondylium violaceum]